MASILGTSGGNVKKILALVYGFSVAGHQGLCYKSKTLCGETAY